MKPAPIPPQLDSRPRSYGRVNAYTCQKCGVITWTYDRDEGTTPFMMICKAGCGEGMAHSAFYRVPSDHPPPTHEWYRADDAEARRMDKKWPGSWGHHENGGLFLRAMETEEDRNG